ncbi:MAG: hypothetical protein AAB731_02725 [Patescibacteria group bacterium]
MREEIEMTTTLWLGARGDIGTIRRDRITPFTMKQLCSGATIKARRGEDHCNMAYSIGSKRVLTALYGEDDDDDRGKCGWNMRLYTRGPVNTWEPLVEWLDRNGLELEGVNDSPYAEFILTGLAPEHLPNSGRLTPVTETTPLYLTAMGTISLSDATDKPGHSVTPFTVAELEADTAVLAATSRMRATLTPEQGVIAYDFTHYDDKPHTDKGYTTLYWLLAQNGLRLRGIRAINRMRIAP